MGVVCSLLKGGQYYGFVGCSGVHILQYQVSNPMQDYFTNEKVVLIKTLVVSAIK